MKARILNVESLLWLALALALVGSLKHLATVFASFDGNTLLGWIQAIAIDTGLFALAYKIKVRKSAKQGIRLLSAGVILFTVISIYGNLTYGLQALNGSLPDWIRITKPIVLAATLPVLVLLLSHLLSDDRQHAHDQAKREAKRVNIRPNDTSNDTTLDRANDTRKDTKQQRQERVLSLLQEGMSQSQIASELGVSLVTIKRDTKELNGKVSGGEQ